MQETAAAVAVPPGEGEARWWFGELATVKLASAQTGGAFSLVEVVAPPGLDVPLHVHHAEDETFVVLRGSARFEVGGARHDASAGAVLFAPRGVPHRYEVGEAGAEMLFLFTPGGFEGFVRASSVPAERPTLPPPDVRPPADLAGAAAAHRVEILA